jgi:hypothetical protein
MLLNISIINTISSETLVAATIILCNSVDVRHTAIAAEYKFALLSRNQESSYINISENYEATYTFTKGFY